MIEIVVRGPEAETGRGEDLDLVIGGEVEETAEMVEEEEAEEGAKERIEGGALAPETEEAIKKTSVNQPGVDPKKPKQDEERSLTNTGISHHLALNISPLYNTKPCKRLDKFPRLSHYRQQQ